MVSSLVQTYRTCMPASRADVEDQIWRNRSFKDSDSEKISRIPLEVRDLTFDRLLVKVTELNIEGKRNLSLAPDGW